MAVRVLLVESTVVESGSHSCLSSDHEARTNFDSSPPSAVTSDSSYGIVMVTPVPEDDDSEVTNWPDESCDVISIPLPPTTFPVEVSVITALVILVLTEFESDEIPKTPAGICIWKLPPISLLRMVPPCEGVISEDLPSLMEYPPKAKRVMFRVTLPPEDTKIVCSVDA